MTKREIKPGDWVRFYRDGKLILGIVNYVGDHEGWHSSWDIYTDVGATTVNAIFEVRSAAAAEARRDG